MGDEIAANGTESRGDELEALLLPELEEHQNAVPDASSVEEPLAARTSGRKRPVGKTRELFLINSIWNSIPGLL